MLCSTAIGLDHDPEAAQSLEEKDFAQFTGTPHPDDLQRLGFEMHPVSDQPLTFAFLVASTICFLPSRSAPSAFRDHMLAGGGTRKCRGDE